MVMPWYFLAINIIHPINHLTHLIINIMTHQRERAMLHSTHTIYLRITITLLDITLRHTTKPTSTDMATTFTMENMDIMKTHPTMSEVNLI